MLTIGGVKKECKAGRGGWTQSELHEEAKKRGFTGPERASKKELCDFLLAKDPPDAPKEKAKKTKILMKSSPKEKKEGKTSEVSADQVLLKIVKDSDTKTFMELKDPDLTLLDPEDGEVFLLERIFSSEVKDEFREKVRRVFFAQVSSKFGETSEVVSKLVLRVRDKMAVLMPDTGVKLFEVPDVEAKGSFTLGKIPLFLKKVLGSRISAHQFSFISVWAQGEFTIPENIPMKLGRVKVPVVYPMFYQTAGTRTSSILFLDPKERTFFHIDIFDAGHFKEVVREVWKRIASSPLSLQGPWKDITPQIFPIASELQFIFMGSVDPVTPQGRENELALVCYLVHFRIEFPEVSFEKLFLKFSSMPHIQIKEYLDAYKKWIASSSGDIESTFCI